MYAETDSDLGDYKPRLNPTFVANVRRKRHAIEMARMNDQRQKMAAEIAELKKQLAEGRKEAKQRSRLEIQKEEVAVARRAAMEMIEDETSAWTGVSAANIIAEIANVHRVGVCDILGPRRDNRIIEARFDAIVAVSAAKPLLSLPAIGRIFNRDHTSILHALQKRGAWPRKPTGKDAR